VDNQLVKQFEQVAQDIRNEERARISDDINKAYSDIFRGLERLGAYGTLPTSAIPVKAKVKTVKTARRPRTPTAATTEQLATVLELFGQSDVTLTVKQIKNITKIGQVTVGAACKLLLDRNAIRKVGRKGYRLATATTGHPLENGENATDYPAEPEAGD